MRLKSSPAAARRRGENGLAGDGVRVLLVNVPTYGSHLRSIPLGPLYVISACRRGGHDADILDGSLFANRAAFDEALFARRFDVLGLSCMTHNVAEAYRIARAVHERLPAVHVVIGGVHACTVPAEVAAECPFAHVMAGEGEESFPLLLDAYEGRARLEDVPGLYRTEGGRLRSNPPRPISDLDTLPLPAYDLVDFSKYTFGAHGLYFRRKPLTALVTSRGCPFRCSFCAKTALTGYSWRPRSAEGVLDEIEMLTRDYGIREIHFEDDNMALDPKRLEAICNGLIGRGIDISWKCPHGIYASHLPPETFALMRRSGCYSLSFGVESGSDEVLAKAGKAGDTASIRRAIEAAHAAGIQCIGFFIFGLEGETPESVRRTIDFAKSLPLDAAQFNLCVPFKGTPIRERYLELGYVTDCALASYDVDHAVVDLPGLPADALRRWRKRAFLEFYLRPGVLFANLRNVTSFDVVLALLYRLRNIWRA